MGGILEFLLVKHCKNNRIPPEPYNNRSGNTFANYIEAAIKNDIFGENRRWEIVQTHLRDFRNYIHILKEIESTEISWLLLAIYFKYKYLSSVFKDLLN